MFAFFDGAAEDELTLAANRAAFADLRLLLRVLVDVEQVDTGTTILGQAAHLPLVVAPIGCVGFGRRGGDLAIADAAREAGVPYVLSSMATASIERIAREAGGRLWFQAYLFKERAQTTRLIARAERPAGAVWRVRRRRGRGSPRAGNIARRTGARHAAVRYHAGSGDQPGLAGARGVVAV